jgi:hypothetical protein
MGRGTTIEPFEEVGQLGFQQAGALVSAQAFCSPVSLVRRPKIRELAEQIAMRADFISRHLPVCENREEDIDGIVSECSAIVREARRAFGIVGQNVRQQSPCHQSRILRRIAARVL